MNPDDPPGTYEYGYEGPSELVRRATAAAAAQGEILGINPPAPNASWSLEFWGPAIHCQNVSESNRTLILNNYGAFVESKWGAVLDPYFSWIKQEDSSLPFYNGSGAFTMSAASFTSTGTPTLYMAFNAILKQLPRRLRKYLPLSYANSTVQSMGGWPEILRDTTLISCELFNSSYDVQFLYTNGAQNVLVSRPDANSDQPFEAQASSKSISRYASYQAIFDAFSQLLVGEVSTTMSLSTTTSTSLGQTILMDTEELSFLSSQLLLPSSALTHLTNAISRNETKLYGTQGPLLNAMERLFENVTVSMLSQPYLQPNYSSPTAPSPLVNVTFDEYRNVYIYDAVALWVAYGLAISFTALVVLVGGTAMTLNGIAYDNHFSTVLRTSRIQISPIKDKAQYAVDDDGGRPLPKQLREALIVVTSDGGDVDCARQKLIRRP